MAVKDLPVCITPAGSLILPMADVVYFSDSGSPNFKDLEEGCVLQCFAVLECSRVNNQLNPVEDFKRRDEYVQG